MLPLPALPKLKVLHPPSLLLRAFGRTPGRLLYFSWMALRLRPDIIGGFHINLNGLVATVLSRFVRAESLYFCGGGPREVLGGGFYAGNNTMNLDAPDLRLEALLLKCVSELDLVITMGSRTINFFREKGVETVFQVIPGGIDVSRYTSATTVTKDFDVIFVGRLVQVKRVDLLLDAVSELKNRGLCLRAVIIGTGELSQELKEQAVRLQLGNQVTFAGHQSNVNEWLRRSKVFVLTSDSEGLSLALMEAMCCGLPAVVSDVGELGELVEEGQNGCLVRDRSPTAFADALGKVLNNESTFQTLSAKAAESAQRLGIEGASRSWDNALMKNHLPTNQRKSEFSVVRGTTPACGVSER